MKRRYVNRNFERIVIYGRRRVGKTALINEFGKDKPVIYFSALRAAAKEYLSALSKAIQEYKTPEAESFPDYRSLDDAFAEISCIAKTERVAFVMDEYPYLANAQESISSKMQHLIDHVWFCLKFYGVLGSGV